MTQCSLESSVHLCKQKIDSCTSMYIIAICEKVVYIYIFSQKIIQTQSYLLERLLYQEDNYCPFDSFLSYYSLSYSILLLLLQMYSFVLKIITEKKFSFIILWSFIHSWSFFKAKMEKRWKEMIATRLLLLLLLLLPTNENTIDPYPRVC